METAARPRTTGRRNAGLELSLGQEERRILDEAAAASGMTVSAFILSHATDAARDLVADPTSFVLPEGRWNSFVAMLDRNPPPMPGLVASLPLANSVDPN
ncbi:MAG TPA: DUF1778 domain-containing protein [Candidatus Limnocylindrales bacterium]